MPTVIPNSVPAGGFHYLDGGDKITGHGIDDLVKQLASKRRLSGQPVGNPRQDVEEYICAHNPADCYGGQGLGVSREDIRTEIIAAWAASYDNPPALVDAATAQKRAETGCIGCPHNNPYGCCQNKQPKGDLAVSLASLRKHRDVTRYGPELFACSALQWDNRTAIWFEARDLHLSGDLPALPRRCWVPDAISADNG